MLKAISTYVYVKERLHPGLLDGLVRGGAQAIETLRATAPRLRQSQNSMCAKLPTGSRTAASPLHSIHAPMYADYEGGRTGAPPVNVAATDRAQRIEAMDEIKRAIEVAEQIRFASWCNLEPAANRLTIASSGGGDGRRSSTCAPSPSPWECASCWRIFPTAIYTRQAGRFIQITHFDDIGVCFDFGHATSWQRGGSVRNPETPYPLDACHDNAGDRDSHLWPVREPSTGKRQRNC